MHAVVAAVVLLIACGVFLSGLARARAAAAQVKAVSSRRSGIPRGGGQRPVRHEIKLAWEKAKAADWLKQQDHKRRNGNGAGTAASPSRPALAAVLPFRRARGGSQAGGGAPAAPSPAPPAPPPSQSPPSPDGSSPGGNPTVAASTGSAEKLIEGVNQVHAEAASGGIHAKHGAIKSCTEGSIRFSAMAAMISRAMSEPGANYGPEITEPLAKASVHLQAAAMAFSEGDAALTTLINMTVGDLAASARQAPHHTELSENGAR